MKILLRIIIVLFITGFIFPSIPPAQAADSLDITINEIAWMGTEVHYNDEWIELYNKTATAVNLNDWTLKAADGTPEIKLAGTVPAKGFYLLERTDDNTVPNISADQIYIGPLENKGENLELYDNFGNLIDSVNCGSGWFAGDNETKQTMERMEIANWHNSQSPGGTPKAKNSITPESLPDELIEEEPQSLPQDEQKPQIYPTGVVINEVLPSPEGSDAENEWIEIFNQNIFEVNLSDWKIVDVVGSIKTYTFSKETKISPKGFLVFFRPLTKITLNNSGDGLKLLQPNEEILDSLNYNKAPQNQSFNRTESGWVWSNTLTPGSANIIPISQPPGKETQEEFPENGSPETPGIEEPKNGLAAIGEQFPKETPFSILLIAFTLALFFGILILFLKRKIKTS